MVNDQVGHEFEFFSYPADMAPVTKGFVNLCIINHRKAVIRTKGKERQDMNPRNNAFQL